MTKQKWSCTADMWEKISRIASCSCTIGAVPTITLGLGFVGADGNDWMAWSIITSGRGDCSNGCASTRRSCNGAGMCCTDTIKGVTTTCACESNDCPVSLAHEIICKCVCCHRLFPLCGYIYICKVKSLSGLSLPPSLVSTSRVYLHHSFTLLLLAQKLVFLVLPHCEHSFHYHGPGLLQGCRSLRATSACLCRSVERQKADLVPIALDPPTVHGRGCQVPCPIAMTPWCDHKLHDGPACAISHHACITICSSHLLEPGHYHAHPVPHVFGLVGTAAAPVYCFLYATGAYPASDLHQPGVFERSSVRALHLSPVICEVGGADDADWWRCEPSVQWWSVV